MSHFGEFLLYFYLEILGTLLKTSFCIEEIVFLCQLMSFYFLEILLFILQMFTKLCLKLAFYFRSFAEINFMKNYLVFDLHVGCWNHSHNHVDILIYLWIYLILIFGHISSENGMFSFLAYLYYRYAVINTDRWLMIQFRSLKFSWVALFWIEFFNKIALLFILGTALKISLREKNHPS